MLNLVLFFFILLVIKASAYVYAQPLEPLSRLFKELDIAKID